MFGMQALGKPMAIAHYIAAFLVGITFRFYGMRDTGSKPEKVRTGNIFGRAIDALVKARQEDGRPFGQIMGDAVNDSIKTLWMIAGFIMLFSTMVKIIDVVGLYPLIAMPFEMIFGLFSIDPDLVKATVAGFLEIDLGTLAAAKAAAPLVQQVAIAGAIIAWSGLSVHGQVASVLTGTDIRMQPYVVARVLHAVLAYMVTVALMNSVSPAVWESMRVMPVMAGFPMGLTQPGFWHMFMRGLTWATGVPLGLVVIGVCAAIINGGVRWVGVAIRR
jgi:hypothetical protein